MISQYKFIQDYDIGLVVILIFDSFYTERPAKNTLCFVEWFYMQELLLSRNSRMIKISLFVQSTTKIDCCPYLQSTFLRQQKYTEFFSH